MIAVSEVPGQGAAIPEGTAEWPAEDRAQVAEQ